MIDLSRIEEIIDSRRKEICIACAALIGVLVVVLSVQCGISADRTRAERKKAAELAARAIKPEDLWMPAEPLGTPGVQRNREPMSAWTAEEGKKWYTVPDDTILGKLRDASSARVNEMLESVP